MLRSCEHQKSGDSATEIRGGHDSEDGALAPGSIVAEGLVDLDAAEGWRFACCPLGTGLGWPLAWAASARARNLPVCDWALRATCSGVPVAMILPPWSPPSGPRSMSQSADLMTSRLCSMTTSDAPESRSLRNAERSLAMSSKWSPVVGSSRM